MGLLPVDKHALPDLTKESPFLLRILNPSISPRPTMATFVKSALQSLRKYIKKPWEITGPCASPEYRSALPKATEYRPFCPATPPEKVCIPTSEPETVFDIKYYTRDRRRNRPPVRRTVLRKADVERIMAAKTFGPDDFPKVYLTKVVEEDENTHGGGYQK